MMKRNSFLIGSIWLVLLLLLGGEAGAVQIRDRCFVSTATTGTGTIALGAAQQGFQTFDDCGVTDGQLVRYCIEDGSNFETGFGTYTTSGATLSRTVSESSNADAALNLTGSAKVFLCALSADIPSETTPTDTTLVPGTDFFFALKDGVLKRSLITPVDVQTMTTVGSGDSWEKPTGGQTLCFIELWGGGGSGGKGSSGRAAAGGGGGGYASVWLPMSALASTETVTIAAGGAAPTVQLTPGNAGGTSTFGSILTAFGGGRGGIATIDGGGGGGAGAGLFATGLNGNNNTTVPNTAVGDGGGGSGGDSGSVSGTDATPGKGALNEGGGGGGGGAPADGDFGAVGGGAFLGGGGGGAAAEDASPGPGAGGNSNLGGDGGAGSIDATNGVDGQQPGGGGGGGEIGNGGKGGDGMARITCR
jgi:hypothetical protein